MARGRQFAGRGYSEPGLPGRAGLRAARQSLITIPTLSGDADILLQTTNVDPLATVQVRITPKYGAPTIVDAAFDSGTLEQATWRATAALPAGYFTVQAHAVNPAP
jgi:hypothetical protein